MPDYTTDRVWSDQFLPEVRSIVGPLLLEPASFEVDAMEATDLIILHAKDKRIGVRIRRHQFLLRYPNQFTIRYARTSGARTEWEKICRGWGDWFLYGFASEGDKPPLSRWLLIDYDALRYHDDGRNLTGFTGIQDNGDGTSFKWFDVTMFPVDPPILIASSEPVVSRFAA